MASVPESFNPHISGQFSRAGLDDAAPGAEFTKITEGFAAVLFPPAKVHTARAPCPAKEKASKDASPTLLHDNTAAEETTSTAAAPAAAAKTGDATSFFINNEFGGNEDDQAVFYNPAQVVNRDLTICVMETFSRDRKAEPLRKGGVGDRGITIVEALSASGLRSVRYWKEITGLRYIIANDLDPDAVECMRRNLTFNGVPVGAPTLTGNTPAAEWRGVVPNEDDAVVLMQRLGLDPSAELRTAGIRVVPPRNAALGDRATLLTAGTEGEEGEKKEESAAAAGVPTLVPLLQRDRMDVVDLDPYGSASPFLDAAMQCSKEGALLCVTSTDSAILCGTYPETAHAKYNSVTIRHAACHEMAVRTLLAALERTANKHKKYIVPLLSLHIDFYVRVFVRVYTQQAEVKLAACKLAHYFKCTRCPNFSLVPLGRVKVHGKKNGGEEGGAGGEGGEKGQQQQQRGGGKQRKKERRADKREREEAEAAAAASGEAVPAPTSVAAEAEEEKAVPRRLTSDDTVPAEARDAAHPPTFCDFTRQPPNTFPPNHDRSVPFAVNPSTIRNVSYECCVCHGAVAIAGPIYAAPTHDRAFLAKLDAVIAERHAEGRLTATNRIRGLVAAAAEELPNAPMYAEVPEIASLVRTPTPPLPEFVAAVCRLGYAASQVHCNHAGLKTDAPVDVLVGLMLDYKNRAAQQQQQQAQLQIEEGSSAAATTADSTTTKSAAASSGDEGGRKVFVPAITGDFSYSKEFDFRRQNSTHGGAGVVKFVQNAPGWGPKARHRGVARAEE